MLKYNHHPGTTQVEQHQTIDLKKPKRAYNFQQQKEEKGNRRGGTEIEKRKGRNTMSFQRRVRLR